MKSRTVIILWTIAVALGVTIAFVKHTQDAGQEQSTERSPGETLLEDFPAEKVSSIEISDADSTVTLIEKDGTWTVSERDAFPANTRNINDLLRTLADLKVTQGIEAGKSFAPRFGMDEKSSDSAERGITAVFKDSSDKAVATLSFGKNLDAASSQSAFGGGATGRYVRNHSDESGFYAVSEVFGILSADPKSWLDDEFIKVEKIKTVSLSKPGTTDEEWTLTRENETGDFAFVEAFPGVKVDQDVAGQLKSLFSYARFDDVVPASEVEKRETPDMLQTATITTFEGLEYTVRIQPAKQEDGAEETAAKTYLMTVAVSAELPTERKKPAEETEEEAKLADDAFAERLSALENAMAKTKELEGRTFEVSNFTVDALLKDRTELMLKTPAPEPSAPTPSSGGSAFTQPIEIPAQPAPDVSEPDKIEPETSEIEDSGSESPASPSQEEELPEMPEPELPEQE